MALFAPGVRLTAFQRNAFQVDAFEIGAVGLGWHDDWVDKPWYSPDHYYPEDIEFIMAQQKSGKSKYQWLPDWFAPQRQKELTERWYEEHLRAMLERRRKKK